MIAYNSSIPHPSPTLSSSDISVYLTLFSDYPLNILINGFEFTEFISAVTELTKVIIPGKINTSVNINAKFYSLIFFLYGRV